jgi:eukaryotic-like serine/threonine-protein kinase
VTVAATLLDDRYSLDEQIGAGGFCEVWRGTDTVLTRPVAVKLLHAGYAHQPDARARFKAEARHAGALSHQNIARVYDYGEPAGGRPYLVMELIEGPSLASVLAGGPLPAARTLDAVAQVAAGLQTAHSAGLVHRDIKPANILFTREGTVRITDFGIAYAVGSAPLTATGTVMGTPGYLAPERLEGAEAGPASDLYALGIVAYECLAGGQPFSGPPLEVAIAHRDRPLPPLPAWLPAEVTEFVMALTAKDPARRPASADQVADQARRLRDHLSPATIGARRPVPAGAPPTITDATESQARGAAPDPTRNLQTRPRAVTAVLDRTRNGRPRRPWTLVAATLVALAALICLILLTATGFASDAHQTVPPSSGPPTPAQSAGQRPSATPDAGASTATPVTNTPAPPPAPPPGPHPHKKHPGHGNGPGPGPGPGNAQGSGPP